MPPKLVVERSVDLGCIDLNNNADARVVVTNAGREALVISEAKTSCHCQGVYVESPTGVKLAIRNLSIPAGESVTLGIGFVVTGQVGVPAYVVVELLSNDPIDGDTRISIQYTPTAKLYFVPNSVVFGSVAPGSTVSARVAVFADGRADKIRPGKLFCEPRNLFDIQFVPKPSTDVELKLGNSIAVEVGSLEVTLRAPAEPQTINSLLALYQDGKEIAGLPVTAQCKPDYEMMPSVIALPRHSSQGDLYYSDILCRSRDGQPFVLKVKKKSPLVAITGIGIEAVPVHVFRVTYEGGRNVEATESIEFTAGWSDIRLPLQMSPRQKDADHQKIDTEVK